MHRLILILFMAGFGFHARAAHAQSCERLFAPTRSIVEVLSRHARTEWLGIPSVTESEMSRFDAKMLERADQVARELTYMPGAERVKTVLYPAAGFDAATAFRVFEHAETVIGIDNHPFSAAESKSFHLNREQAGWVHYRDLDQLQTMAGGAIRSVLSLGAHIRILNVQAFHVAGRTGGYPTVHGVIEFDSGVGTPLRRYVHLQSAKDTSRDAKLPWLDSLLTGGYDAILVKAAMKTYRPYAESLGGLFVDKLREHAGILVDGDGVMSTWPWREQPRLLTSMKVHVIETDISGLGYQNVHIIKFGD